MSVININEPIILANQQKLELSQCNIYNLYDAQAKKRVLVVQIPVYDENSVFVKNLEKTYSNSLYNTIYAKYQNDAALLFAVLKDLGIETQMPFVGDLHN